MTGRKRVVKGREVSGLVSSCSVTCDLGLSEWRGRRVDVEGEGAVRRIKVRVRTTGSGVSGAGEICLTHHFSMVRSSKGSEDCNVVT